jgi:hypothetical protein
LAKGFNEKRLIGENDSSVPNLPGVTSLSVILDGFVYIETLTFMMFDMFVVTSTRP